LWEHRDYGFNRHSLGLKPGHNGLQVVVDFLFRVLALWYAKNPITVFFSLGVPGGTRGDYVVGWKVSGYNLRRCLTGWMAYGKLVNKAQLKE
jgi:hypothetical protein